MTYTDIPTNSVELLLTACLLAGIVLAVLYAGHSRRGYLLPLLAAFGVRVAAGIVHRFMVVLPQGGADAVRFERRAWEWAQSGCGNLGEHLNLGASYVHSWVIGNVYACTDRAPLVFQSVNIGLGLATVYLVGRIAEELWDRKAGVRAMWVAALFPILVINAAVPLREVWFTAFFLLGMLWLVRWVRSGRMIYLIGAVGVILAAGIIHGGAVFAIVAVALVLAGWALREVLRGTFHGRVRASVVGGGVVLVSAGLAGFLAFGDMRFSSIGEVGAVMERAETLDERAAAARGGSAYPGYLVPANDLHALVLTPIRMGYLLVGPPPWEVRAAFHLFGMLDGLLYLALMVLLLRYWRDWWSRPEYRLLLVVFLALAVVFAWGVNNFGTGVRHRAKFLGILLALGAGLLGRRRWRLERLEALRNRRVYGGRRTDGEGSAPSRASTLLRRVGWVQ
ncbi:MULTISPECIES: glycosyltransferase family 39 protein [Halorhodospira]|uniref:ArnT family glycosyltransferase n=1 Tax=Halorhodospira TaxID=85108 RepID=UPI001EE8625E|nr:MULTISPECIES: hypothetical protein [Halorhodospira]MCG5529233.1 hypothetical protein [Halorhodospira halophila]MCG5544581.1 hypothetical protein [Halorhodospira sp. 9628]